MRCFWTLPLLRGDEVPHAPYVGRDRRGKWPGNVASMRLRGGIEFQADHGGAFAWATMGVKRLMICWRARPGVLDRGGL